MLSPAMATMLAVVTTDAAIDRADACSARWPRAVSESFDCLIVDGCALHQRHRARARRTAGRAPSTHTRSPTRSPRCAASLAEQMARDAEGATKFVAVQVVGARSDADARIAARGVANSQLVQCSLNGADPYWGRVLSELGRERRAHRSRTGRHRLQRRHRVPRRHRLRARRGRARRARWPRRHRDPLRPAPRRTARRRCSRPTSRTRTSTRTGARRDATQSTRARPNGCATRGRRRTILAEALPYIREFSGRDRRHQVRRPRDGEPRARRPLRDRRRAHAARRDEPGRRARRRSADHRPDAQARQGARVRRRPARHRRRDRSTSCAWRSSARSTARSSRR